jgi:hypothetical protein
VEETNDCNLPRAAEERLLKRKKKMGREDERGRVPESYLEWICLRVRCSPGATPSWEPISATLAKGPEMDPQKMS